MGLLGGNLDYDHEEFHNGHSLSRRSGISGVMTLFVSWWRLEQFEVVEMEYSIAFSKRAKSEWRSLEFLAAREN
ncbi:hypothetical protein N7509_002545 [Penicillium cosmopolitanum]|uniref:Uncharacterized protein n=1 Tax=Penicillium cosmopolitanum TaxID=1131564 RepID=A0A9W9W8Z8_9EURO|nr:uncharacterized protein N7509_002545 [Penicillium cosmopolitanum]KAJ5408662.1 hypothetical protein N7509_002545 [Penicillium cosmopolitanum]